VSFPLYLDENVDVQLAAMLQKIDCNALTALEAGRANQGISDEDQLAFATEHGRALFTFDLVDFASLVSAWSKEGKHHNGVIVGQQKPVHELCQALLVLFDLHPNGMDDLLLWLPPV